MNTRLLELAQRRALLVARAASQRTQLEQAATPWRKPLALVDRGVRVARFLGRHRVLVAGMASFAVAQRPRRLSGWIQRGLLVWRTALVLKRMLSG